MQLGMIGLGKMGANMVRRLMKGGHECVVYDRSEASVRSLSKEGATPAYSLAELCERLAAPRAVCMMVPAGAVEAVLAELGPLLASDDVVIDGGNSHYQDAIRRAGQFEPRNIHYVDMGTSGGVWGLERGYCLMLGGARAAIERLDPMLRVLAPGPTTIAATPQRASSTADNGYLHCGPSGAGHFVKMVHNGIEYGLMAAYAEGFNILKHANIGKLHSQGAAETTALQHPEHYEFDFDLGEIAEVWRRGSVITSWLLDLTAQALASEPELSRFAGTVSDSGEGRWTLQAAIDEGVPAQVLAAALFERFASRGRDEFQNKVLSAMRLGFGGHLEKKEPA